LAADWPQWGGTSQRNVCSAERGLPTSFVPGKKRPDGSGVDLKTTENVAWVAKLGSETYSSPTVAAGRVYIGTNDANLGDPRYRSTEGGLLLSLDARTGGVVWRLVCPKLNVAHKSSQFEEMNLGVCGSATVDGDRVYVVTSRCEVACLDVAGMRNGNQGPFVDEAQYTAGPGNKPIPSAATDADILWLYDMIGRHRVWPHDASNCSPLVYGDYVYVCTGNGVDGESHPAPLAPSLIVLDKRTGRLVAHDDEKIGQRVFHGQWSSPSLGIVNGRPLILFAAGDGVCYAFEPLAKSSDRPVLLQKVWQFQCNPPERLVRDGKPINYWDGDKRNHRGNNDDGKYIGPNEIIATPVCYKNRVYVALGQDPVHGRGRGLLWCIDATGTGDVSRTAGRWRYEDLDRSLSTVSIADGRLYVADRPGVIHCLDLDSGRRLWTYDTKSEIWASALLANGRLYVGSRKYFFVLAAGGSPTLLSKIRLGSPAWATPAAANGTLYVASYGYLWAVRGKGRGE
jgi:outer membrane protein assembly factor BamB